MLGWLVSERIEPHVMVFDKSARQDGTFLREDFKYDPAGRPSTRARSPLPTNLAAKDPVRH